MADYEQEVMENDTVEPLPIRRKGVYLLPNFFTTAVLFSGFYAIVAAMKGAFALATLVVFVAMLADALDGRVARLTNTQSPFGAEYDSLSDMVAFGIAPALIAYSWALYHLGKIGWLVAFFYAATTALRLARFNLPEGHADKRYFQGLPCPAAAGFISGIIWVGTIYHLRGGMIDISIVCATALAGFLMVSNIKYRSFKDIDLRGNTPFVALLFVVFFFVAIAFDPPRVLATFFSLYIVLGPITALFRLKKKQDKTNSPVMPNPLI